MRFKTLHWRRILRQWWPRESPSTPHGRQCNRAHARGRHPHSSARSNTRVIGPTCSSSLLRRILYFRAEATIATINWHIRPERIVHGWIDSQHPAKAGQTTALLSRLPSELKGARQKPPPRRRRTSPLGISRSAPGSVQAISARKLESENSPRISC